jgi:serine/threonine protein kinase/tetratricopeptide (TPR) repeat protein
VSVDKAYDEFREAWLDGEPVDVEALCRKYPSCEAELRARIEAFVAVESGLDQDVRETKAFSRGLEDIEGRELGEFRLIRELGRGGMGVVYEARQISLNRVVALKVLPAHLTLRKETVERFKREAATAAKLNHPGIVEIFAVGEEEGNHFFAMEFVRGAPLDRILERLRNSVASSLNGAQVGEAVIKERHQSVDHPAPGDGERHEFWNRSYIETVCRIVARVTDALEHAHRAGVIHRDVKPSNILLRPDGSVVLTDFGLAREEGLPSLTLSGELAGTPHYIAPEQASHRNETVDHRVDIYSLGVTLYELLTLSRPFEGNSSQEVLSKIANRNPSTPRARNELIHKDLETICLTAMEKDPARRYQSAGEFGGDLESFLGFRPIKARSIGVATKTYRLIRRNPAYSAVFVLLFLLVVVGPLVLGVQQKLANIEIAKALEQAEEEAATAQQVIGYLEDIFKSSNPLKGKGKEVRAYELLKQGVAKIDDELKDQHKVRARLMNVMGMTYLWLGIYDEAEVLLKDSVETYQAVLGKGQAETIKAAVDLSEVYALQHRSDLAVPLLEQVLDDARQAQGEDFFLVPLIMSRLGLQSRLMGRYEESEEMLLASIEAFRRIHGDEDDRIAVGQMELARLYLDLGRLDEAEPLLISCLAICEQSEGEDDVNTAQALSSLGILYLRKNQLDKAEPYLTDALERFEHNLGDNHSYVHYVGLNAAEMYWGLDRLERSESLFLKSIEGFRRTMGKDNSMTLRAMDRLVHFYADQGRFGEAASMARDVLKNTPPDAPEYRKRKTLLDDLLSEVSVSD